MGKLIQKTADKTSIYEGWWVDDKPEGLGRWIEDLMSGYFYQGEFYNGIPCGKGIVKWEDGIQAYGQFDGLISGTGLMIYPSGKIYEGEFVYKRRHGQGILKKNGQIDQVGRWNNNLYVEGKELENAITKK